MNIGTLEVLCDHIENVTPIKSGQDAPMLRLLLDDVDASGLMRQMASVLDAEDLLDYIHPSLIREYLAKEDSKVLSPREQDKALSDAFFNAEVVGVKL